MKWTIDSSPHPSQSSLFRPRVLDTLHDLIERQSIEPRVTRLRVVALARVELLEKPRGVHRPKLAQQGLQAPRPNFFLGGVFHDD